MGRGGFGEEGFREGGSDILLIIYIFFFLFFSSFWGVFFKKGRIFADGWKEEKENLYVV